MVSGLCIMVSTKWALFVNNVLYGKCTRQKYALLKCLLYKKEQILSKCENKGILVTDFNTFFISKFGSIIASIQAAECPEVLCYRKVIAKLSINDVLSSEQEIETGVQGSV